MTLPMNIHSIQKNW